MNYFRITPLRNEQLGFTRDAVDYLIRFMVVQHTNRFSNPKRILVRVGITGPLQAVWFLRGLSSEKLPQIALNKAYEFLLEKIEETPHLESEYTLELTSRNMPSTPPDVDEEPIILNEPREFELA